MTIHTTAQKNTFSIKDFFSKYDKIRWELRIWSHILKKSLMKNFTFCAVHQTVSASFFIHFSRTKIKLNHWIPLHRILNTSYHFKVTNRDTKKVWKMLFKVTNKINIVLLPLLLTLNIFHIFFQCLYCLIWTCICLLSVNIADKKICSLICNFIL